MKKFLCVLLSILMLLACATAAFAGTDKTLRFKEDGTFRILQINDTQDVGSSNGNLIKFIRAAVDTQKPDLIVFVGDQLADVYPLANAEDYEKALDNVFNIIDEAGIPFVATLGNHDHDRASKLSESEMYKLYAKHAMWCGTENGPDSFTCSIPVYASSGSKIALNVYMMDSNNKAESGGYSGINKTQLDWYNAKCAELKAANGGEVVPSINYQHVPVKEIYQLLKPCNENDSGAVYVRRGSSKGFYNLDESKVTEGKLGEAPCSEDFDTITGQYQAWVANGDIIGGWFAHDHVNTFAGVTDDGIRLGYNGGAGFRAYGDGENRTVRVFNFSENDVANYETHEVFFKDIVGPYSTSLVDICSPALLTTLMKFIYTLFGWLIKMFK